jgi:hypothetical protein
MFHVKLSKISSPPRLLPKLSTLCLDWIHLSTTGYTTRRQRKESNSLRRIGPLNRTRATQDPKTSQFGINSIMEIRIWSWLTSQHSPTSSICSLSQNPTTMTSINGSNQINIPLPPLTSSGNTFTWNLRTPEEEEAN